MKHENHYDVLIIGGGIIGCSTALWLAERGRRVKLLERAKVGSEQSSRAWGFIRQQGRHEAELPLAQEANRLWHVLTQRFGKSAIQFEVGGILVPAETTDDEKRVDIGLVAAKEYGLDSRRVTAEEIRHLVPELGGQWRSGLYTAGDAYAEPPVATQTIADAARRAGVEIDENCVVTQLIMTDGKITGVKTATHNLYADKVLLAAGIGTAHLARQVGIDLPIQIIRSSVGRTSTAPLFTRVAVWGPKVAYRPCMDGSFILGNGYRGSGADYDVTLESLRGMKYFLPSYKRNWRQLRLSVGKEFIQGLGNSLGLRSTAEAMPEPRINIEKVTRNFDYFRTLFPHLNDIRLEKSWAGRIDLTPDVIPILDQPETVKNLFIAAGFSGHGFALGPAVGLQMANWMIEGQPRLNFDVFKNSRFKNGSYGHSKYAL